MAKAQGYLEWIKKTEQTHLQGFAARSRDGSQAVASVNSYLDEFACSECQSSVGRAPTVQATEDKVLKFAAENRS